MDRHLKGHCTSADEAVIERLIRGPKVEAT